MDFTSIRNVFATEEGIYTASFEDNDSGDDFLKIQLWAFRGVQTWGIKLANLDTKDSYMCRLTSGDLILLAIDNDNCGNNLLL